MKKMSKTKADKNLQKKKMHLKNKSEKDKMVEM